MIQTDRRRINEMLAVTKLSKEDELKFNNCLSLSTSIYSGVAKGKLCCIWGLIPPTLMSEQAYIWLYTTEEVREHEFLFVRNSQQAMEKMLEEYPTIVGHTKADQPRSIRWLKWLGAVYGEPTDGVIPFRIRKKVLHG